MTESIGYITVRFEVLVERESDRETGRDESYIRFDNAAVLENTVPEHRHEWLDQELSFGFPFDDLPRGMSMAISKTLVLPDDEEDHANLDGDYEAELLYARGEL